MKDNNGALHIRKTITIDCIVVEGNHYDMRYNDGEQWWEMRDASGIHFANADTIEQAEEYASNRYMDGDWDTFTDG